VKKLRGQRSHPELGRVGAGLFHTLGRAWARARQGEKSGKAKVATKRYWENQCAAGPGVEGPGSADKLDRI